MTHTCAFCGKEFTPKRESLIVKYCSPKCRNSARFFESAEDRSEHFYDRRGIKKRILELYDSDLSAQEIAEAVGAKSVTTVYTTWRKAGLGKRLTPLQKTIKQLREEGKCAAEIISITGCKNVTTVTKQIGMEFSEEEKQRSNVLRYQKASATMLGRNQFNDAQAQRVARYRPDWEYIGPSDSQKGFIKIRHKECGTVIDRCSHCIPRVYRSLYCPTCAKQDKKRKQERLKQEQEERRRERRRAFWKQRFIQTEIPFRSCIECGVFFIGTRPGFCSDECRRKHSNRTHEKRLDRATKKDSTITLQKLYKRDAGVCWICGELCDYDDYSIDACGHFIVGKNYPSIDHVYPLSRGGDHTWDNVRLAHHYCNTLKNDKVVS